jgi:hypothetical protein
LAEGARIRIETTDPLAVIDIPHFCREDGHHLVTAVAIDGGHAFIIEKGSQPDQRLPETASAPPGIPGMASGLSTSAALSARPMPGSLESRQTIRR